MSLAFTFDNFRLIYTGIATFMWIVSLCFSTEYMRHYERKGRYYVFTLITYLATVGVFLSADFYTLFIFFEIMSLASYVWVAFDERKESLRAAETYLAVSVIGGLTMLMGLFLLYDALKDIGMTEGILRFDRMRYVYDAVCMMEDTSLSHRIWAAGICMLVGFGAKAGAFPIHIWLPKAHPVAPAPASALLSGILTKTGILGILMLSRYLFAPVYALQDKWAMMILIIGVCTMLIGAILAIFSTDIKRTLACSSVSQMGFILVGIAVSDFSTSGMGVSGSLLHMVGHSIFKLILFSAAGVIYMNTHVLDLNKIRGFGRRKYLLNAVFLSGSLGIACIPGFNGYVSKTLIHECIVELKEYLAYISYTGGTSILSYSTLNVIEWLFIISGGCTVAYMLKLYICVFIEKNPDTELQAEYDAQGKYMNPLTSAVLAITALIPPVLGLTAKYLMNGIATLSAPALDIDVTGEYVLEHYFEWECVKGGLISIAVGVVIYFGIIRICMMNDDKSEYLDLWPKWMDLENVIYRPVIQYAIPFVLTVVCRAFDKAVDSIVFRLRKTVFKDSKETEELTEGNRITYVLGVIAGRISRIRRKRLKARGVKLNPPVNYVHKFALNYERDRESRTVIIRSLSFGLMLFCLGLVLMVAYILLTRWW